MFTLSGLNLSQSRGGKSEAQVEIHGMTPKVGRADVACTLRHLTAHLRLLNPVSVQCLRGNGREEG